MISQNNTMCVTMRQSRGIIERTRNNSFVRQKACDPALIKSGTKTADNQWPISIQPMFHVWTLTCVYHTSHQRNNISSPVEPCKVIFRQNLLLQAYFESSGSDHAIQTRVRQLTLSFAVGKVTICENELEFLLYSLHTCLYMSTKSSF